MDEKSREEHAGACGMAGKPPAWEQAQGVQGKGGVVRSVSGRRRGRSTADPAGLSSQHEVIILYTQRDNERYLQQEGKTVPFLTSRYSGAVWRMDWKE